MADREFVTTAAHVAVVEGSGWSFFVPTSRDAGYTNVTVFIFHSRTFSYSSLSRLLSAANPESGLISYQYDNNGNLTRKTDARGVRTDYVYDVLNRV